MEEHPASRDATSFQFFRVSRTRTIAATGVFAALAILLTSVSQFLFLSFPLIPYLQFDLGEVAIILAFLLFGPVPATAAAFVEFITLMEIGANIPVGPLLKIAAILSTVIGLWLGILIAAKASKKTNRSLLMGTGLGLGLLSRIIMMTFANYYLLVIFYKLSLSDMAHSVVGLTVAPSNALTIVLGLTGLFNALQLTFAFVVSYLVIREPHLRNSLHTNRFTWFESLGKRIERTK